VDRDRNEIDLTAGLEDTNVGLDDDTDGNDNGNDNGNDAGNVIENIITTRPEPYHLLLRWRIPTALLAVFLCRGSGNYTRTQYERLNRLQRPLVRRKLINPLPHFSTLNRTYFDFVKDHCLPPVRTVTLPPDNPSLTSSDDYKIDVVDPRTWAAYDVANPEFVGLVYNSANNTDPSTMDHIPLVSDRRSLNSELLSFSDSSLGSSFPFTSRVGDTVSVVVDDSHNLDPVPSPSSSQNIVATVHSITYNSPSDPTLAATLAPFFRAADMCVRLMASPPFSSSVWVLIYRFWTTPNDSRRRLLFEVRNFPSSPLFVQHGVYDVNLLSSLPRAPSPPGVSVGALPNGRRFVVYRFILFTDGFSVSRSSYRQAKAGGIYLLPMGLPPHYRKSPRFIHTVSLSPPGVSAVRVIGELIENQWDCQRCR